MPAPFDSTLGGALTLGYGYEFSGSTWGAGKSNGFNRVTGIADTVAGSNGFAGTTNKWPVVSGLFWNHWSFGVFNNDRVEIYKNAGTSYKASDATGVGFLDVIAGMNGTTNVADAVVEVIKHYGLPSANSGCVGLGILPQTRELVVYGTNPVPAVTGIATSLDGITSVVTCGAAHGLANGQYVKFLNVSTTPQINNGKYQASVIDATTFSINENITAVADGAGALVVSPIVGFTGLYLPASPTAVGFAHTSAGWNLRVQGVGTASGSAICTVAWGSASAFMYWGGDGSNLINTAKWSGGGIFASYTYAGSALQTGTNMADGCAALQAIYDPTPKTKLAVFFGTSLMAGAWQHEGEGIAGLFAEQNPTYRVLCFAAGGATSTQVSTFINPGADFARYGAGMTVTQRVAILDALIANDAIAATGSPNMTTYGTNVAAINTFLIGQGYTPVWEAALPISNSDSTDANVVAYETSRRAANVLLKALPGAVVVDPTLYPPFLVDYGSASTNAAKATVVRSVTRGRPYEIPDNTANVNDPTSLITCDEVHTGHQGTRTRAARISTTQNGGVAVFGSGRPKTLIVPIPVRSAHRTSTNRIVISHRQVALPRK